MSDGCAPPQAPGPRPGSRSLAVDTVCFPAGDAHPVTGHFSWRLPPPWACLGVQGAREDLRLAPRVMARQIPAPPSPAPPRGHRGARHRQRDTRATEAQRALYDTQRGPLVTGTRLTLPLSCLSLSPAPISVFVSLCLSPDPSQEMTAELPAPPLFPPVTLTSECGSEGGCVMPGLWEESEAGAPKTELGGAPWFLRQLWKAAIDISGGPGGPVGGSRRSSLRPPLAGPPSPSQDPPPAPLPAQCGHSWAASGLEGRWQPVLHLKMCL